MKKIFSLLLISLLLLSLCACGIEPTLVGTTPDSNNSSTSISGKTFKLGDSVEYKDVVIKFIGVTESNGSQFNQPAEGSVYILCEFEIINNSKEELTVSSMMSFSGYCDDYSCTYSIGALMEKGDKDQLDGSIVAGKKMKGVVGYEVPSDWKELEIHYTPDLLDDTKIVFVTTNN